MKWVGLTGGIATGKSAAARLIEGLGYPVIDADRIAHQIVGLGQTGLKKVVSQFGKVVLNSDLTLNRSALGEIIFNSVEKKLVLESLLHPLIQEEVAKLRHEFENEHRSMCFYDVPLLFEKKMQSQFFATVLIWCDFDSQHRRLKLRNNLSDAQVNSRLRSQMNLSEKLPLAEYCVDNSTTVANLEIQVKNLIHRLETRD